MNIKLSFPLLLVLVEMGIYLSNDMYLPALPDLSQSLGYWEASSPLGFIMAPYSL